MSVDHLLLASRLRCHEQGHPGAYWAIRVVSNGSRHLVFWCATCEQPATRECYGTLAQAVSADWLHSNNGIRAE